MTTRPTGQLRSSRRARVALLALLVTAVGLSGRSAPTDATWHDRVRVAAATGTSSACVPSDGLVDVYAHRAAASAWDQIEVLHFDNLPESCRGSGPGVGSTGTVTLRSGTTVLAMGTLQHQYGGGPLAADGFTFLSAPASPPHGPPVPAPLDRRLWMGPDQADRPTIDLRLDGWPVPTRWRSPVVATGIDHEALAMAVWSSEDQGSTWARKKAFDSSPTFDAVNAVATNGQSLWVAVGQRQGRIGIWYSTSWRLDTWVPATIHLPAGHDALSNNVLTNVATNGSGAWVAVGTSGVVLTSSQGTEWYATPPAQVPGSGPGAGMLGVATDGLRWVIAGNTSTASGARGAVWTTAASGWSRPVPNGAWACAVGRRTPTPEGCQDTGPGAGPTSVATDGAGRWIVTGSGAPDTGLDPCEPAAGAWTATDPDLLTWTGRTLTGETAPASPCTPVPGNGYVNGLAPSIPPGSPGTASWLAVGSHPGPSAWAYSSADDLWSTLTGPPGASLPTSAQFLTVAADHAGTWLVGGNGDTVASSLYRARPADGQLTWEAVALDLPLRYVTDVAFEFLLPTQTPP